MITNKPTRSVCSTRIDWRYKFRNFGPSWFHHSVPTCTVPFWANTKKNIACNEKKEISLNVPLFLFTYDLYVWQKKHSKFKTNWSFVKAEKFLYCLISRATKMKFIWDRAILSVKHIHCIISLLTFLKSYNHNIQCHHLHHWMQNFYHFHRVCNIQYHYIFLPDI